MLNTFFCAKMIDYNKIKIIIFSNIGKDDNVPILLYDNHGLIEPLTITSQSFLNGLVVYECRPSVKLELGNEYSIGIESFGVCPVNVDDFPFRDDFDQEYTYDGDDLGANYSKNETTFKIWAPLASKVVLLLKENDVFETFKMEREDKGVYSITIKGDLDGYRYRYQITNSGVSDIVIDPYGKGSTSNGRDSVVVNLEKTRIDMHSANLPKTKNYVDTVIYELNVRDFTIDPSTDIVNKGKFLGLIEEGRKTKAGNPAGFDYLKSLNITHVQLMPVLDFKTVDEDDPDKKYNWGYDPQQYFSLEGSYSTNPNDAYSRINEFKQVVAKFHEAGIKVNLDVVYNHVYDQQVSTFECVVPNYYFRHKKNGFLCNASGCGNDVASERPMVRKLIVDSLKYLLKEFDVDGFRFDLFGLTDIDTANVILKELRAIKSDVMIYGEGWDMPTNLPSDKKTTIYNSFKLPEVAFFNDVYRDMTRGSNFDIGNGYLTGNTSFIEGFKASVLGNSTNYCYNPRFCSANQSINYAECHDNLTLFDKISASYPDMPLETKLKMINSINGAISFSVGVPFYHAGQEIGLSKMGEDNTYNKGDEYNMFRWDILDQRFSNYLYFSSVIKFRRDIIQKKLFEINEIESASSFENLYNGAFLMKINDIVYGDSIRDYIISFNPTPDVLKVEFDDYYKVILSEAGASFKSKIFIKNAQIDPYSVLVFMKKKED